ncbi:hypothetical protein [Thauera sp. Sel9]|uniref:hypothetical protein n=1 Tax=Thauera sp. Sel9 TaxID=2974299 RepID=UPI0021E13C7A|nr:hypothetical protein [Thauera sp. Sel9]MCV2217248.1 hypothetical protein [Thauera sp. Sel9]
MARLTWALALALALLAVQGEARIHLIGHAGELLQGGNAGSMPGTSGEAESDGEHVAGACLECLALSGIDMPLGGPSPARTHHAAMLRPPEAAALPVPDASPLRPRCRAPPTSSPSALLA